MAFHKVERHLLNVKSQSLHQIIKLTKRCFMNLLIVVTVSIEPFACDSLSITSSKERFLQDSLGILKRMLKNF